MILSHLQIEEIAAAVTKDFNEFFFGKRAAPETHYARATPIDQLAGDYLGLRVSYARLSEDGSICGLTAYADTEYTATYQGAARVIPLKANEVLLDSGFMEPGQVRARCGKRRFTLAHECAHQILFQMESDEAQRACEASYSPRIACPDHEQLIGQLADSRALVDFSQGLDIRLITPDNVALLNKVRTKTVHFAWDDPNVDLTGCFQRFSELSKIRDFRRKRVYVLTNYNSTHEQDLYRVDTLRRMGYDPYVMVYERPTAPPVTRHLQRWVNNKRIFRTVEHFSDYEPARGLAERSGEGPPPMP